MRTKHRSRRNVSLLAAVTLASLMTAGAARATAAPAESGAGKKPNIVIIWGDDIGQDNVSLYHRGLMGGRTPNIDRIGKEGALFTDAYAQQSCTAGRASFILGQNPFRTGLLTIGMPGGKQGVRAIDPTICRVAQATWLHDLPGGQESSG